ncbi:transcriptional regulator [Legionella pneumophila serogroup 1]|uniref:Uncharacterized protein n=4 Tax=Legionella TaxID=445 RepID=W0BAW2_9GAMM|nr:MULTISPECIES: hypothetical protein [Legionella]STY15751.1 putative transcriptional regulator [Legionella longbeachae]AHE65811.1 hypothetical protein Loa_00222 [Legionella oakridgensis ATCC 33761 = DSM 21215]KTD38120.1 putative transcriptional regulator [Legionella oakridgensis]KXB23487.1 transcriptional regulator [Legionella pneumophila]KXB23741.1 transcriptional regulator [Legionella pneumophila]
MAKNINYHDYLIESLKEPSEAAGYLNAALDDGDIDGFLEALHNVIEAYGSMTKLSEKFQERYNPNSESIRISFMSNANDFEDQKND